jgi:glyoxylase-like metal-dependent hydrolase (beta-lactamase superfamily II)
MGSYIDGLVRLNDMSPPMLFPGHGPPCTNPRKLLEKYIRHRTARHERVLEAVASGIDSLDRISEYAYLDTPDAHPLLCLDQTLSHLKALISSGEVELRDGGYFLLD